ncbi:MAG: hypothetical protein ACOYZ6_05540 [Chloroflexota bacterium]
MKTRVFVFLSIIVLLFLGSCSNAFTPVPNTPTPTTTFTPEPTGTPTPTPFPTPLRGKGSVSAQISCIVAVTPQGQSLTTLMGSGHTISLIVVHSQGLKYSFVAKAVTDTESRVFFNNIDPGGYHLAFGDASITYSIPASSLLPFVGVVENEMRDLGKVEVILSSVDCVTLSQ